MAVEWISKKMIIGNGKTKTSEDFIFSKGTMNEHFVGIQAFLSKYKGDSHHCVGELGIEFKSSLKDGNIIQVELTQTLNDASSHALDTTESWVQVVVIAQMNMTDSNVSFGNIGMTGEQYKTKVDEFQENLISVSACLGSFHSHFFSSSNKLVDHNINSIGASCSAEPQNRSALLNANILIKQNAETVSTTKRLDLNIIRIATGLNAGLAMRTVHFTSGKAGVAHLNSTKEVEFDFEVVSAIALITGFEMKYEGADTHNVGTIMVGASKWDNTKYLSGSADINGANPAIKIDKKKVTITSNASMFEMSNSTKTKNESDSNKVTYLIIAIP
ncbi:hypothetical protein [Fluviicola taffensis]|uniref:hypothetical protein n=1 Tax=Fluviicola taffensis TaxID=191579 RepID=UPI0031381661